jgi:hypothetical protein
MSLQVTIQIGGQIQESLADLQDGLRDKGAMNLRIAKESEKWIKSPAVAGRISAEQHRTANRLGANPTGHLADAYQAIESVSDDDSARLLVPSHSRLRAAFGGYTVRPTKSKFLTIPIAAEAYGRRAREFDDLFVMSRPGKALMLARREEGDTQRGYMRARTYQNRKTRDRDANIKPMYLLLKEVDIKGDETLIPFPELEEVAVTAALDYIDEEIERSLG